MNTIARVILALLVLASSFLYVRTLQQDIAAKEVTIANKEGIIAEQADALKKERIATATLEKDRFEYTQRIKEADEKSNSLTACIANGTCGVRVVKQVCPANPQAATSDPSGDQYARAQLGPAMGVTVGAIDKGIRTLEAKYLLCQKTLNVYHALID